MICEIVSDEDSGLGRAAASKLVNILKRALTSE